MATRAPMLPTGMFEAALVRLDTSVDSREDQRSQPWQFPQEHLVLFRSSRPPAKVRDLQHGALVCQNDKYTAVLGIAQEVSTVVIWDSGVDHRDLLPTCVTVGMGQIQRALKQLNVSRKGKLFAVVLSPYTPVHNVKLARAPTWHKSVWGRGLLPDLEGAGRPKKRLRVKSPAFGASCFICIFSSYVRDVSRFLSLTF